MWVEDHYIIMAMSKGDCVIIARATVGAHPWDVLYRLRLVDGDPVSRVVLIRCLSCAIFDDRYRLLFFQSLVVALVLNRLDCCNSVLTGLPANLIRRLQSVIQIAVASALRTHHRRARLPALASHTGAHHLQDRRTDLPNSERQCLSVLVVTFRSCR